MKPMKKRRILALLVCLSVLIGLVPFHGATAGDVVAEADKPINYGAAIGNTAVFDIYFPVPVSDQPENVQSPWGTDCEHLSDEETPDDLMLVITNYYLGANGMLWYKVKAAPGHTLPEKLQNYPWVYQDDVDSPLGASLILHSGGRNFIFDAEGNPLTAAEIGLYDTVELTCQSTLLGSASYQWQILADDEWTDILGEDTASIPANYSLLYSALGPTQQAQLRCVTTSGSKSVTSDPITITVDTYFDYDNYVHPETPDQPADTIEPKMMVKSTRAGGVMPLAEGDSNVCYVTVQYLFENGTQAANSYVAQVPLNKEQSVTAEFPYVQGYLPYYEGVRQDSLTIEKTFTGNEVYTVIYEPTMVEYTVDIYFQNIENDDYSFYDSVSYEGLTGSKVPVDTGTFAGMRELLHETPPIAADGTTHIEVYYDRIYYMTRVYLAGGYGIYSVYARYGADLQSHLTAPTRPGYTFIGWDEYKVDSDADDVPDTGGDNIADTVYPTVPAKNLAYVALWKDNPTAQVNVVFWGQEANDDNKYSYLQTKELHVKPGLELTYALTGNYVCGLNEHTHGTGCTTKCGKTEHTHGDGNCDCLIVGHIHNVGDCYCEKELCTSHTRDCYSFSNCTVDSKAANNINNATQYDTVGDLTVYRTGSMGNRKYYVRINTAYYQITNYGYYFNADNISVSTTCHQSHTSACCIIATHTHDDSCCSIEEHTHNGTCYTCIEHTHTQATCGFPLFDKYDEDLWTLSTKPEHKETITVERDGSSVLNVYFNRTTRTLTFNYDYRNSKYQKTESITAKWGALISSQYKKIAENAGSSFWSASTSGSGPYTNFFGIMPQTSATYYNRGTTGSTGSMTYYGQNLDGSGYSELFKVDGVGGYTVTKEDRYEFEGYVYSHGSSNGAQCAGATFYYKRANNTLEFYSGNDIVRTESTPYEQPLNIYADYTNPPLPSNVEKDSHKFVGWYLNPDCTRAADLTTMTMPASNLALYAKWEPVHHKVRIVLNKKADGVYGPEDSVIISGDQKVEYLEVLHGTIVFSGNQDPTPPIPTNGQYKFLGWFYEDDGVELMWDFEHHPVVKETVIYAKWSSEVLVPYTIYYKDSLGNDIAEPTISSSLAGHSLTVKAKVGNELYATYRDGYFPNVVSHSIELHIENAETGVTYTFVYTKVDAIQYTVHYVDADNGNAEMPDSPVVKSSTYAVVTETFKSYADEELYPAYKDHVPDAYQKPLVLTADPNQNHLYFYYRKSETSGVWFIEYFVQDKNKPALYNPHSDEGEVGDIGAIIKPTWPLDLSTENYIFKEAIINNGTTTKTVTSWNEVQGAITKEGLSIRVYYDRKTYPYKIVYLNKDTGAPIDGCDEFVSPESQWKMYGSTATATEHVALPTIDGYTYDSSTTRTIVQDDPNNITKNIVYVYYTEQYIRLDFKVVGPTGCGTVNPEFTRVKIHSDNSATATATPAEGYRFVGWYTDAGCTSLLTKEPMAILWKPTDGWQPHTYYAKFERGVADLTIKRENAEDGQVYVYQIQSKTDPALQMYVTVVGNGSVTVRDLPITDYTVTQQKDWSWRHGDGAQDVTLDADGETVVFDDSFSNDYWLNGNSELEKNVKGATG